MLQYAAKLGSSPGKFDGLYWPADASKGEEASPFGPLIAQSAAYLARTQVKGDPYHGYHFRILTRQGQSAPGGAYNYMVNGRLISGFAMVAWPDQYGESGVMTFIVNHNGKIFEKDLGRNTSAVAEKMTSFDPGPGWRPRRSKVGPSLSTLPCSRGARMKQTVPDHRCRVAGRRIRPSRRGPGRRQGRDDLVARPGLDRAEAQDHRHRRGDRRRQARDHAQGPEGQGRAAVGVAGRAQPRAGQGRRPASW